MRGHSGVGKKEGKGRKGGERKRTEGTRENFTLK